MFMKPETNFLYLRCRLSTTCVAKSSSFNTEVTVNYTFSFYTRVHPKVLIVVLKLCPETFLGGILCTIQKI